MQVFKLFFKLVKENKTSIFVYIFVTIIVSILFVKTGATTTGTSLQEGAFKPSIVILDDDQSIASKDLSTYLKGKTEIVKLQEDEIEDALFYNQISYVLTIPKGYEQTLLNQEKVILEKQIKPNAAATFLINQYVEDYLTSMQNYVTRLPEASFQEIAKMVKQDFKQEVKITYANQENKEQVQAYFNFFGYSFTCCIITAIGAAMCVFQRKAISQRNAVSPTTSFSISCQQVLAYICFAAFLFFIATLFGWIIFPSGMGEAFTPYMLLNLGVYLVPCLGIAYLIGTLIRSLEVQNGIANVLCLGMAFLGGSFVPQSMISDGLLRIAAFTPNYWFVKGNELLYTMENFSWEHLQPVFQYMGIQILFGLACVSIALLYSKQKRKNIV